MAHRTNVTPVQGNFEVSPDEPTTVTDPACGKEIERKESKNMLFRGDEVIYFCSRECEMNYLYPAKKKAS